MLSFDEFDAYAVQNIDVVRNKLSHLCTTLKQQPVCLHHGNLLNLYCENDRQVLCVSCVYKTTDHKEHRIKSLDAVEKVVQRETFRYEQKLYSEVHQLEHIKEEIDAMAKEVQQYYHMISNYTITIITDSIDALNQMRVNMQKKLGVSYRRTNTIITRYSQAVANIISMLEYNINNAQIMNSLGKYILLKELSLKDTLVQDLINKFSENKHLIEQWRVYNHDVERLVDKHKTQQSNKIDYYRVKQF